MAGAALTQIKTIEPPVSDIVYLIRPTVIGRDDLVRTVECTNLGAGMENMSKAPSTTPFSQPEKLAPGLAHVHAYWEDLKRGAANMPFADDVNIATMPDMAGRLMLIEVFDKPVRFRLAMLGEQIKGRNGDGAVGKFLDEIEVHAPLQYLSSQSSATIESRAPTHYRHGGGRHREHVLPLDGYARILLPLWGNGRIAMLLGAVIPE
jgi:hypothetical protein